MIIKNNEVARFGKFLLKFELKGVDSLMRTRFVKLLQEHLDELNIEKDTLLQEYAKRDENGEIVSEKNEETDEEFISLTNGREYHLELYKLESEDFIIEETPSKMKMLEAVKELVMNCDWLLSGEEAMEFDRWYEIVEDIGVEVEDD